MLTMTGSVMIEEAFELARDAIQALRDSRQLYAPRIAESAAGRVISSA
jgi:hypothetical protein